MQTQTVDVGDEVLQQISELRQLDVKILIVLLYFATIDQGPKFQLGLTTRAHRFSRVTSFEVGAAPHGARCVRPSCHDGTEPAARFSNSTDRILLL